MTVIRQDDGVTYKILDTNLVPANEKPATPPAKQENLNSPANYRSKVKPSPPPISSDLRAAERDQRASPPARATTMGDEWQRGLLGGGAPPRGDRRRSEED